MTPKKQIDDKRAPLDEQPIALSVAEESGILPDTDRRASEAEAVPEEATEVPEVRYAVSAAQVQAIQTAVDQASRETGYAQAQAFAAIQQQLTDLLK